MPFHIIIYDRNRKTFWPSILREPSGEWHLASATILNSFFELAKETSGDIIKQTNNCHANSKRIRWHHLSFVNLSQDCCWLQKPQLLQLNSSNLCCKNWIESQNVYVLLLDYLQSPCWLHQETQLFKGTILIKRHKCRQNKKFLNK